MKWARVRASRRDRTQGSTRHRLFGGWPLRASSALSATSGGADVSVMPITDRRTERSRAFSVRDLVANRAQFCWLTASVIAVGAYIVSLFVLQRPVLGYSVVWDGWMSNIATILPVAPMLIRARRYANMRGAWFTMAIGVILFNLGKLLHTLHYANVNPFLNPTPSDVLYLLSYLAFAVAVAIMMQHSFGPRAISVRLDGIIAGLAFGALASMYWFNQVAKISGRPLLVELNLAYPILVMVLLVLLVAGLVPKRFHVDRSTSLLIIGLISFAIGDIIQLNQVASSSYVPNALLDASWPIGICCFGLAAWCRADRREEVRRESDPVRGLNLIPVIFGVLSTAILAMSLVNPTSRATSFMALGSLSLVILRMAITQSEVRELGRTNFSEARTDHVTGLSNRRAFLEDGELKMASLRSTQQLGIVLIDLDGFKEVNDSIGHAYGDELLKIIGQRFANKLAPSSAIARIGGDEFAYTFVIETNEDPVASANELARTLNNPVALDGTKVRVSASIGVAVLPKHGCTHAELLRSADVAMYEAKRNHGVVCVYRDEIDLNSRERLSLIDELRSAIERRHLILHYQPTLDLRTGQVRGVEALVRWQHPTRGLMYPDEFIPLAERVGLIVPLTRAVLELAIAEVARLERNGQSLQMSVNISQWDLMDERLPESLDRMLKWYDISPSRITLEVTESSLGQDPARAKSSLEKLRFRGVRISIDDFGVGYSSLSQLLELPVDELKIDKSFVIALSTDTRAISLIRSTIEMARALSLTVVAEGVENAENLEELRRIGTDVVQGDFIARPLTAPQLDEFLSPTPVESFVPLVLSGVSQN